MKLNSFTLRHPYRYIVILEGIVVLVYLLIGTAAYFFNLSNMAIYGLANLCLTLFAIMYLTAIRAWKTVGFKSADKLRKLVFFLVPLVPAGFNLIPGIRIESLSYVTVIFAVTLLVGFAEETIFRGLMLQAIKPLGHWRAAVITALLFGLTHAMNALAGKSALESAMQIGYAFAIGFAYAALVLKKEILWPLVITHFLTDFIFFIQKPGFVLPFFWQNTIVISLGIGFMVFGIVLMMRSDHPAGKFAQYADGGGQFSPGR